MRTAPRRLPQAGNTEGTASFALLGGWAGIERGLLAAAVAMLREAAAVNRELRDPAPLRWCTGGVVSGRDGR